MTKHFAILLLSILMLTNIGLATQVSGEKPASSIEFRKPLNLSNTTDESLGPTILVSGANVYVTWLEYNYDREYSNIFFRASYDNGKHFEPAILISDTPGMNSFPVMAAQGGELFIVWSNSSFLASDISDRLQFRSSNDSGKSFGKTVDLGRTIQGLYDIAVSGSHVYINYVQFTDEGTRLVFRASHDSGNTFEKPFVYKTGCGWAYPNVAASGSDVYILAGNWCLVDSPIIFKVSHDYGNTFSKAKKLGSGYHLDLATGGDNVYAIWETGDYPGWGGVTFVVSHDRGDTFQKSQSLTDSDPDITNSEPRIQANDNDVYIVWQANDFGLSDYLGFVYFRASHDGGDSFGRMMRFTGTDESATRPSVTSDSRGNVYVVWHSLNPEGNVGGKIVLKASGNGGFSFGSKTILDEDTGDWGFVAPQVATSKNNKLIVSWWDSPVFGGPGDIILVKTR